jgi:hypothetical protein
MYIAINYKLKFYQILYYNNMFYVKVTQKFMTMY